MSTSLQAPVIEPTRYHRELLEYLRSEEREIWNWIASQRVQAEVADSLRRELLKSTYRIGREASPELYRAAESVAARLGHSGSITVYQAEQTTRLNAAMAWLPGEIHIVFQGPIQEILSETELSALLAHEIAHHILFSIDGGAYLTVEQVLSAMLGDRAASYAHQQTWKNFHLYTEIFCDRMTLEMCGDVPTCVGMLVKIGTGLRTVNAEDYLKQAAEVLSGGSTTSDGVTHPETFIRAHALELWADDPKEADSALESIIEGPFAIGKLDLLRQKKVSSLTRGLLGHFLAARWIRTDTILAHAKQFFDDFDRAKSDARTIDELKAALAAGDEPFRDYFCYVLLDFVTSDPDLEDSPLAAALLLARQLELEEPFVAIAGKELRLSKRQFDTIQKHAESIVAEAEKHPPDRPHA
jgi:predicted SprT family Zn-dependent metalloprotease